MTTKAWKRAGLACGLAAACILGADAQRGAKAQGDAGQTGEVGAQRLLNADQSPNDWLMYHQSYKSHHFSALDQINTENVKNLRIAWLHTPSGAKRGVQSFPLVVNGTLYYTTANSQVWALDGATGAFLWKYEPQLDEERAQGTIYNPYNRGIAVAYGKVYVGTVDGRVIALDAKTGKEIWDTQVVGNDESNKGFTGAPLIVKDKLIIGTTGGEYSGCCGPIYGIDAQSGKKLWQFDTIGGDERSRASWGNESWKIGGGGGWMTGGYDAATDTVYWGTANPSPDYDWGGANWKTEGARPGDNLYTSGIVALDPNTGKLKSYFQENPHDAWDFDGAVGEFVMVERDGKNYVVHPNKGGFVYVYNRDTSQVPLKVENVWQLGKTANFVKGVDPKTGALIGRRDLQIGMNKAVCPAIDGAISWNAGSYDPANNLYFKVGMEFCADIDVQKVERPGSSQLHLGASYEFIAPPGHQKAFGHVSARDPISGKVAWEVEYKYPPLASLLGTKGGLVFVPGADGWFDALDAKTGKKLWTHNNGIGHHGGVISYKIGDKQYIAVVTGWGSHVSGDYKVLFGEPFNSMPTNNGQLIVFSLP
ncbi:pyrroloquinoline quinone-dependent dehydrogenase [Paracraurococcus lichenis]|uniref:PQQ-binding-like beta-propeller repeat protein n=1 Tax=Paracraurococcus lichenis TaxID=3064888 RepID=A0ABT9DZS9_9PROT|nr:PQQ-binding-like beta-propeller repeat protein [Paracraurococcus sp. LOR1-02]MDO9709383.1 PQQ-binding-like beta-propeller repeat protein [Paracraurococcus sp. LOR1-02]